MNAFVQPLGTPWALEGPSRTASPLHPAVGSYTRAAPEVRPSRPSGALWAAGLFAAGAALLGRRRGRRGREAEQLTLRLARGFGDSSERPDPDRLQPPTKPGERKPYDLPGPRAAPWKKENAEYLSDPNVTKKWIRPKGFKKKGKVVDMTQEIFDRASILRAKYKRPRFGWKEVMQDDLATSRLTGELPAIGTGEVWLSKYLSHCGVCSRRDVTGLVLQGRVMLNGQVVQSPVIRVDPTKDEVTLDGQKQTLRTLDEIIWIMLYKPKGCITAMEDPEGRRTVMDIVPFAKKRRLVPVGRIDRNASGIILLTNDYEWHTILAHPRYGHEKRYRVEVYNGVPSREKIQALTKGLELPDEERMLLPLVDMEVENGLKMGQIATLRFTLNEGKYRQIRRMFEFIGHPVRAIKRTQFGLLKLDPELKPGEWRQLSAREIRRLKGPTILRRPTMHPQDKMMMDQKTMQALENGGSVDWPMEMEHVRGVPKNRPGPPPSDRLDRSSDRGSRQASSDWDSRPRDRDRSPSPSEWDDEESPSEWDSRPQVRRPAPSGRGRSPPPGER